MREQVVIRSQTSWSSLCTLLCVFTENYNVAAHNAIVLKAESVVDKNEWINKLQKVIQARGGQVGSVSMRQSLSEGSLVSHWWPTFMFNFLLPQNPCSICFWHIRYSFFIPQVVLLTFFFFCCLYFRIRWLENPLTQKRNSGGCPKKYAVTSKLFLTALQPMFRRWTTLIL